MMLPKPVEGPLLPVLSFTEDGRLDQSSDPALVLYRAAGFQRLVEGFYEGLVGNPDVADSILSVANSLNIAPNLAFALAWSESRFNPNAVGHNPSSVDRGLFQLNSRSFPHLRRWDFFNPSLNARHGLAYLKKRLEQTRDVKTALAMYNAGAGRISSGDIPVSTRYYVDKTLAYWEDLEKEFFSHVFLSRSD